MDHITKLNRLKLKKIIEEELFYREFYRASELDALKEQETPPQKDPPPGGAPAARLGKKIISKSKQAAGEKQRGKDIASGETLGGVDNKERAILVDIEKILTAIAEKDDLNKYRPQLQTVIDMLRKKAGV